MEFHTVTYIGGSTIGYSFADVPPIVTISPNVFFPAANAVNLAVEAGTGGINPSNPQEIYFDAT